jgi:hypothetical protein
MLPSSASTTSNLAVTGVSAQWRTRTGLRGRSNCETRGESTATTVGTSRSSPAPDGRPMWVSDLRPRTRARHHLRPPRPGHPTLDEWTDQAHVVLADLGYEGENTRLTCPIKNTPGRELNVDQRTVNALHAATSLAERGN